MAAGQWQQARAALERASDFADVSSDISYLQALVLAHENQSRGQILDSLENAIKTASWEKYSESQARLMQAQLLIDMRRYSAALDAIAARVRLTGEEADSAILRLTALKGLANSGLIRISPLNGGPESRPLALALPVPAEFRHRMLETMDRYPRDTRPLHILFDYALHRGIAHQEPNPDDIMLLDIALRRLPFLLESDPRLAWKAAHFAATDDEARRLLAPYRSGSLLAQADGFSPSPESIPLALNLGLLDDIDAVDELLSNDIIDKDIIHNVHRMLRSEDGRNHLARRLHSFTGTIIEDEDRDGIPESRAIYRQGDLAEFHYDMNQDGAADVSVWFDSNSPQRAEMAILPAAVPSADPLDAGFAKAVLDWESYPAVQKIQLGTETYFYAPMGFLFSPLVFEEIGASDSFRGLSFPGLDPLSPGLSLRMLFFSAVSVQRPCEEFDGGVEYILLERGLPLRAEVRLNGELVSETEFENGRPVIQRLDLYLDGRMDTIRRFDADESER